VARREGKWQSEVVVLARRDSKEERNGRRPGGPTRDVLVDICKRDGCQAAEARRHCRSAKKRRFIFQAECPMEHHGNLGGGLSGWGRSGRRAASSIRTPPHKICDALRGQVRSASNCLLAASGQPRRRPNRALHNNLSEAGRPNPVVTEIPHSGPCHMYTAMAR
jgi:hypothetical protein